MSKNFELMQKAGKDSVFRPGVVTEVTPPVGNHEAHERSGPREVTALDLNEVSGTEVLRLVQQIFLLQTQKPPRVVVFAGVDHGNGCTEICARAAQILANSVHGSVCLVETNLRSPALSISFGTTNHHGLTDSLLNAGPIRSFAKPVWGERLWLLSCGSLAGDSLNLLSSGHLKTRLAEMRKEFEFVLMDAPPLTRYADALTLGQLSDGLVLVLEAGSTRREAAIKVSENLRASHVQVLGAVLNKRTFPIPESLYRKL